MKIAIKTLGCKLNQAESEEITRRLQLTGFQLVDFKDKADLYLINSCNVTSAANRKSRQAVHFVKNRYPQAKIWACGCAKNLTKEVDLFFKNKEEIPRAVLNFYSSSKDKCSFFFCTSQCKNKNYRNIRVFRTRSFIKIQEGCDNFCSYCIIPYLRGHSRSVSPDGIIKKINQRIQERYREVVLTGVNIGKYEGKLKKIKNERFNLTKLIKLILEKTKIERIRLSSINPEDIIINKEFIKLFENPRMCQHLHLSLQSGSNSVLKRMRRYYTTGMYQEIVEKFYSRYPNFSFTTDIIVGFPAETEKEFRETCNFVEAIRFLKVHIFRYSKRKGTLAALMKGQVDEGIKKGRAKKLEKIVLNSRKKFQEKMIGKEFKVLFEKEKDGYWEGFTDNYLRIRLKSKRNLENKILCIKIKGENLVEFE